MTAVRHMRKLVTFPVTHCSCNRLQVLVHVHEHVFLVCRLITKFKSYFWHCLQFYMLAVNSIVDLLFLCVKNLCAKIVTKCIKQKRTCTYHTTVSESLLFRFHQREMRPTCVFITSADMLLLH